MILYSRNIEQVVDRHERATFVKDVVITKGAVPLGMVRKRLATNGGGTRAPVLLVHGFGQNRYAWHLPSRSVANYLAREGYDVFNLDLRGHGRSRKLGATPASGVDDYVSQDLPAAVEEVIRLSGGRSPFLIGHSLGGLVSYAAAPSLVGGVAGIASLGSPYHFARGSLPLRALALFFEATKRSGLPVGSLNIGLGPVGGLLKRLRPVAESRLTPLPFRGWQAGALEPHILDEHFSLAFDRAVIAEMQNIFGWAVSKRFGGHESDYEARFEAMNLPLLVVAGENDDLAPPIGVRPAYERSRSSDKTYRAVPFGHIDILVGRDAPKVVWPMLSEWLFARSEGRSAAAA